jgi:F0F1-type ATP synthase assembly protein I
MQKENFYKGVKNISMITFIPFMLAAGPLSGYFVGDFIQKKFNLSTYVVILSVIVGFTAGAMETIRIIKIVARMNK